MLMTAHLNDETLAAYIDNRLDSQTRQPVTEHLASCGECREIVLLTAAFQAEEKKSANVTRGTFGTRSGLAAAALAAAATIVILAQPGSLFVRDRFEKILKIPKLGWEWTMNVLQPGPGVDDLVGASQGVRERPSDGRLTGGFAYGSKPTTMRGGAEAENEDLSAKVKLFEIRAELEDARRDPHALGIARLLTAEKGKKDVSDAVNALEIAHSRASGTKRDAIATDLAAALIARARWSGDAKDQERALVLSNEVLQRQPQSPEALWNRAVALQLLQQKREALAAFDGYLQVDSDSPWAKEARDRKADIASY
jgi:tetratricopeptide (TPR) repeat protein